MKLCKECGEQTIGRSDKVFCSSYCKSTWHNKKYYSDRKIMNEINTILRRNRRILIDLLDSKITSISTHSLMEKGFNFSYFTSSNKLESGKKCLFCYEIGYFQNTPDSFKIKLKNKNY